MSKLSVCFCYSFTRPSEPADLVLFSEARPGVPEEESKNYLLRCREYARTYKVYLVPGLFELQQRLCMCLLSPEGKALALQKAIFMNLLHHPSLAAGERILVTDTDFGKVALLPDIDIFHPEVSRAAALQGAEVLIASQFYDPYDCTPARVASGCFAAAQENQLPVLSVSNQNCCAALPCSLTEDHSGYLLHPTAEFPALATVYPNKTNQLRLENDQMRTLNPEFCSRYAPQLSL